MTTPTSETWAERLNAWRWSLVPIDESCTVRTNGNGRLVSVSSTARSPSDRQMRIIYLMGKDTPRSEIARRMGISRVRVWQLYTAGIESLGHVTGEATG